MHSVIIKNFVFKMAGPTKDKQNNKNVQTRVKHQT